MRRAHPRHRNVCLPQWLLLALTLGGLLLGTSRSRADVDVIGDVLPIDNPFTTDDNEGLPGGLGNFLDNTRPANTNEQITFEGWIDFDFSDPTGDSDENVNENVLIGTASYGSVQIGAPTQIRFMNLIVGGTTTVDTTLMVGTGNLEISGAGALYNNDYEVLPSFLRNAGVTPEQISVNPRATEAEKDGLDGADDGFDMIVGRDGGSGNVSILAGGRAEIHDSVIIAEARGSSGIITVDGFGSYFGSGGFAAGGTTNEADDPRILVVGGLGVGQLIITNGGNVLSEAFTSATFDSLGAVMGGASVRTGTGNAAEPDPGGVGIGLVDGIGSKWTIGGGLQVGGFSDADNVLFGTGDDIEGNDVRYASDVGSATLTIQNGGVVQVTNPPDAGAAINLPTQLLIGRRGIIELNKDILDGRLIVGNPQEIGGGDEATVLINDGIIRGGGRIDTGIFRNRHVGEVRVGPNEKLLISATAGLDAADAGMLDNLPMLNYGLIEVIEGEIEFDRGEDDVMTDPPEFQAFQNRALDVNDPAQLISRRVGLIEAFDATLRFGTGLSNQGFMLFTGGDNDVHGDVTNNAFTLPADPDGEFGEGVINIVGNETFVVFHDILTNNGTIDVAPHTLGFTAGDLILGPTSTLSLTLGGGDSGQDLSHISILDNGVLFGELEVALFTSGAIPISPMAGDSYELMHANFGLTGDFTSFSLPFLGTGLGWVPFLDAPAGTYNLLVQATALAMGSDLNGDGVVNSLDVAIWRANAGNPGGLGDVNMDGLVDGSDLLIIQGDFGPVPGAGSGNGNQQVPEPASGLLLLAVGLGWMASTRRWPR